MEINHQNYEVYIVDYLDGSLAPEKVAELVAFLEEHPHLAEGLDLEPAESLMPDESIVFDAKSALKKTVVAVEEIDESNYEEFFARKYEGDLSETEEEALASFLEANDSLKKEYQLFGMVTLEPEEELKLEDNGFKKVIIPVREIDASNFETFLIRELENDLSDEESTILASFVEQNKATVASIRSAYSKTILSDQEVIVYANKGDLKRPLIVPIYQKPLFYWSAAASIVILFMGYLFYYDSAVVDSPSWAGAISSSVESPLYESEIMEEAHPTIMDTVSKNRGLMAEQTLSVNVTEKNEVSQGNRSSVHKSQAITQKTEAIEIAERNDPLVEANSSSGKDTTVLMPSPKINDDALVQHQENDSANVDPIVTIEDEKEMLAYSDVNGKISESPSRSRVYSVREYAVKRLKNKMGEDEDPNRERRLTRADIVLAGVNGANKVLGADMKVDKSYNDEGDIVGLRISSKRFEWAKWFRK